MKVDVEARADVRRHLESPGVAAIARREDSGSGLELPAVVLGGLRVADGPWGGQLEGVRGAVWRRGGWRLGHHGADELNLRAERVRLKSGCDGSGCDGCVMDGRARHPP